MKVPFMIRPIRRSDVDMLREGLAQLSSRTRYERFHAVVNALTDEQWEYLTNVDGVDHVALVAYLTREFRGARAGQIIGVARFVRDTRDPTRAEVAFVVHDDVQRCGVGSALRDALVRAARRRGISIFRAQVLADNVAIRRLLAPLPIVRTHVDSLEVRIDTAPTASSAWR
jgi:GNAT superfamily N-acetyltransferase